MDDLLLKDMEIKSKATPQVIAVWNFWKQNPNKGLTRIEALHLFGIANLPDVIYRLRNEHDMAIFGERRVDARGKPYMRYFINLPLSLAA